MTYLHLAQASLLYNLKVDPVLFQVNLCNFKKKLHDPAYGFCIVVGNSHTITIVIDCNLKYRNHNHNRVFLHAIVIIITPCDHSIIVMIIIITPCDHSIIVIVNLQSAQPCHPVDICFVTLSFMGSALQLIIN